jgi:K+-transporting ATPase ATPase C chain
MRSHLRANLWLLLLTLLVCAVVYPAALLGLGQTVLHNKADGSLVFDQNGKAIGSRLVAQPFTGEAYFQPRPSAASYNGAGTAGTNWGANNCRLRDRVARQLGPIAKYRSGPKQGQTVGPDLEAWFQKDQFRGEPAIVAQWARNYSTLAQNWVKADSLHADFVTAWQEKNPADVARWKQDNLDNPEPKPEDLAVAFFINYSQSNPGTFPVAVERPAADGKTEKRIEPVKEGSEIQSTFFDMWLQDNQQVELEPVPADMVMASGSGLDPHITLSNALYQLDRVAAKWAAATQRDPTQVRTEITDILREHAAAPLGGLVGVDLVNVLEINLSLRERYSP